MICKRCGSQMFNNASSCPFCGAVIGAENETDPNQNLIPDLESLTALDGGMPSLSVDPLPASPVQPPAQAPAQPVNPAPQNPFPQNAAPQNPFGQDSVSQNPFPQNAAPQNPFGQDPVSQNPFPQSAAPQNPFGQDPVPQSPFPQNAAEQNPLPPLSGMKSGSSDGFAPLPGLSGGGTATKSDFLGGMSMRLAAKVLIVLAILAFSLPFVTVSCSMGDYGDKVLATYSGFQLMTGDIGDEDGDGDGDGDGDEDPAAEMNETLNGLFGEDFFQNYADNDEDEDDDAFYNYQDSDDMLNLFGNIQKTENDPAANAEAELRQENQGKKNGFLIGSLLCGLVAFGLLFIKGKKLEIFSMLGCVLAAMLTLVSSLTFQSFYHVTDNSDLAEYIVVKTRYGVFVVVILFVLAALASLKESIDINSSSGDY